LTVLIFVAVAEESEVRAGILAGPVEAPAALIGNTGIDTECALSYMPAKNGFRYSGKLLCNLYVTLFSLRFLRVLMKRAFVLTDANDFSRTSTL